MTAATNRRALCADVRVERGSFVLDVSVTLSPGEVLGVIGANGAGKSTLLGALAGTLGIGLGEISLGGRVLSRVRPGSRPVSLPRAERRIGLLDQRARLFPHLDARSNIAFGPRARGVPRREADALAEEWLERVDLGGRGDAREADLSGGQQQRVAIARTLAADPELLLLDEPFAALDVTSRELLRALLIAEVERLGLPVILVTHDPVDLMALADRAIVLERGRVAQRGPVADVLGRPASSFAAEFAGRGLLTGIASARGTLLVDGAPVAELAGVGPLPPTGEAAVASFDPHAVSVRRPRPGDYRIGYPADPAPAPQRWIGTVSELQAGRTGVRVVCAEWPECFAEVPVPRAIELGLAVGDRVEFELPREAVGFTA